MELAQLTEEEQKLVDGYLSGEPLEEEQAEPEEQKPEEEAPKEEPEPEPKAEEPKDDGRPTTPEAWAKLRWEAAEAKRQAKAALEEVERLKNPPKAIPAKEENYEGHVEGRIETVEDRVRRLESEREQERKEEQERQELRDAIGEMSQYEDRYAQKVPNYGEAANYVKGLIGASIKMLEPHIQPEALAKRVVKTYLTKAANAYAQGLDPAEAIHREAMALGYAPKAEPKEEERKPDNFRKIAENKKRSGMAAASGSGGTPETTEEMAVNMSTAEFSRLTPEQIDRMLYGNI